MRVTIWKLLLPLLALLASLSLPEPALAKITVGLIIPKGTANSAEMHRSFQETLRAEVPNTDIEFVLQRPFPDTIALGNATRKLVATGVDLIVTYGSTATIAALNEKTHLPLIYCGVYDPDNAPFAGVDLTGCGYKVPLSSLLRYLRELKPITTVSAVYCSLENDSVRQINELTELSRSQQITLIPINLKTGDELDKAQLGRGDAILITNSSVANLQLDKLLALAKTNQQPSISTFPDSNEAGVTISLFNTPQEQSRKTAQIAAQILTGRNPREIRAETVRTTELVFNLREAKGVGVKIPFQLVAEASRVIK